MNVLIMPPALTLREVMSVHVIPDSLETGSTAQVRIHTYIVCLLLIYTLLIYTRTVIVSDIDECSSTEPPCDTHATCTDTSGSYICECVEGFSGNGTICEGGINMQ